VVVGFLYLQYNYRAVIRVSAVFAVENSKGHDPVLYQNW